MSSVYSTNGSDDDSFADYSNDNSISSPNPLLPLWESQVQSSQDIMDFFSPEVKAHQLVPSINGEDEGSVVFLGESGYSLVDYPHPRYLCGAHPFNVDPQAHCDNCFCALCDDRVAKCNNWVAHCKVTNKSMEYKVMHSARQDEQHLSLMQSIASVTFCDDAEKVKKLDAQVVSKLKTTDEEHPKLSEQHVDLKVQVKKLKEENKCLRKEVDVLSKDIEESKMAFSHNMQFLHNLVQLKESELKSLCVTKHISLKGKRSDKKNNYMVKLLVEYLKE